jgi:hypothetical protein
MGDIPYLLKRAKATSGFRFTARQLAERLLAQKAEKRARDKRATAINARATFKPTKKDRGKIIFVSTTGKRNPAKKGRKGYPVYVTKTGKKWLIKQQGAEPFKPRTISELVLPSRANLKTKVSAFQKARLVKIGRQKTIVKLEGSVQAGGSWDFTNKVSDTIASSIKKALSGQRSHRVFLIKFVALVKLPNGSTESISGEVPIERPDHLAIKLAGIRNFVRQKFYSFMARELAFAGYVSNGSANHIRKLAGNKGKDRRHWKDRRGELWAGRQKQVVEILTIEWRIEQAQ